MSLYRKLTRTQNITVSVSARNAWWNNWHRIRALKATDFKEERYTWPGVCFNDEQFLTNMDPRAWKEAREGYTAYDDHLIERSKNGDVAAEERLEWRHMSSKHKDLCCYFEGAMHFAYDIESNMSRDLQLQFCTDASKDTLAGRTLASCIQILQSTHNTRECLASVHLDTAPRDNHTLYIFFRLSRVRKTATRKARC